MKKLFLIFLLLTAVPVRAQTGFAIQVKMLCNTTEIVTAMLKDEYREVATGGGTSNGGMVRLFESHDAGKEQTWTLVISSPSGFSCIMKGGKNWLSDPEIIKGDPT